MAIARVSLRAVGPDRRRRDRRNYEASVVKAPQRRNERREGDRRLDDRVNIDLWLEHAHGDETSYRHVGDLSAGGVRLDQGFSYPVGTRVRLRFNLPNDPDVIEVSAEVMSITPEQDRHNTSLRFLDLKGEDHIRISSFIDARSKE